MSQDIEAKPEPSNVDKYIPSAPADEANADGENCTLLSAQIKDMKTNLAVQSQSHSKNDLGIVRALFVNEDSDVNIFGMYLTPMQLKKRQGWDESLSKMAESRSLSLINLPLDYGALVKNWQASYSYLETLEISQVLYCDSTFRWEHVQKMEADIISLRTGLSKQKIQTLYCQEKLIASHGKVINGMKEEANIKRTEESIKQQELVAAHEEAVVSLNAGYEGQIAQLKTDIDA
ncbi:hypothetical protein BPOR_0396g00110 [Botrytis porri]|uniref:Uncharacterized protein n=1 Tax=Botrytis porri TaxID=87229 RepID=A0A4Z1KS94_9HELO|nr:hypothetical protein BPOR_0396g00110 [Botrytis porri]